MLTAAVNAYLGGDLDMGKAALRDAINLTIGFERLSVAVGTPAKSLRQMVGPEGNPTTANFFKILRALQNSIGVRLRVRAA